MEFDSEDLTRKAVKEIDDKLYVTALTYMVLTKEHKWYINSAEIENGMSFRSAKIRTETIRSAASDKMNGLV